MADITAAASSIPEKLILEPTIPVGVYIQEARNIHLFMQDDRDLMAFYVAPLELYGSLSFLFVTNIAAPRALEEMNLA